MKDGKVELSDADYIDTWKSMEQLVEMGLVKSIGVSNFNSEQLARLLAVAKIKPVTNQVRLINNYQLFVIHIILSKIHNFNGIIINLICIDYYGLCKPCLFL